MIFNSGVPTGGDADVGTPNKNFGGPGVGTGGASGAGVNSVARKNVLIVSKDNSATNPNDDEAGGKLTFTFDRAIQMDEVHLLDIDTNGTTVKLWDAAGALIKQTSVPNRGDNSFQIVALNAIGVKKMEIAFSGGGAVAAIVSSRTELPLPPAPTQFFVVDTNDQSYRYATGGTSLGQFGLVSSVNARGATTTGEGNPMWIVSEEGSTDKVYVYDTRTQASLGSWQAKGVTTPEGIATNGTDLWIVDDGSNKVLRYNGAASRRGGSQSPSSSFNLVSGNQNPKPDRNR